jgi:hypothetical protein
MNKFCLTFITWCFYSGTLQAQYCQVTQLNANKMGFALQFERVRMYLEGCCKPEMVNFSADSPVNDSVFLQLSDRYLSAMAGFPNRSLPAIADAKRYDGKSMYFERTYANVNDRQVTYYLTVRVLFSKKESDLESGKALVENIEVLVGDHIRPFSKRVLKNLRKELKKPPIRFNPPPAIDTR